MSNDALLALADGTIFHGKSIGADGVSTGEVVFNTAITGYQEILTDPSYARQLVTLTASHVGNVGVNSNDNESRGVFCAGLIVRSYSHVPSNWRAENNLSAFLSEHGVVAISDIDTRKLTRLLRDKGAQSGCLMAGPDINLDEGLAAARAFPGLAGMDLAREVTIDAAYDWRAGTLALDAAQDNPKLIPKNVDAVPSYKIVAYDFGIKHNILRLLVDSGCEVIVVPAATPAAEVLARRPDGVFLSNGPGDPEPCDYAINAIAELIAASVPVFGICLGHQLLALASGARTVKMKFGHHGANHPVQDVNTGRVFITSQNHGFAVAEASLPNNLSVTHRSLFDGSIQGVRRVDQPAFGFQGHPEASPGPHDIRELFDQFVQLMAMPDSVSHAN